MLFLLRAETERVDQLEGVAQAVAALNLLRISPKISPILYSMVSVSAARSRKPCR